MSLTARFGFGAAAQDEHADRPLRGAAGHRRKQIAIR
jgi:hypothetical protein